MGSPRVGRFEGSSPQRDGEGVDEVVTQQEVGGGGDGDEVVTQQAVGDGGGDAEAVAIGDVAFEQEEEKQNSVDGNTDQVNENVESALGDGLVLPVVPEQRVGDFPAAADGTGRIAGVVISVNGSDAPQGGLTSIGSLRV